MSNVIQFPDRVLIAEFQAAEALKEQIRMCLGAVCGVYHGRPDDADTMFALAKIEEALILIRAERALRML